MLQSFQKDPPPKFSFPPLFPRIFHRPHLTYPMHPCYGSCKSHLLSAIIFFPFPIYPRMETYTNIFSRLPALPRHQTLPQSFPPVLSTLVLHSKHRPFSQSFKSRSAGVLLFANSTWLSFQVYLPCRHTQVLSAPDFLQNPRETQSPISLLPHLSLWPLILL